MISLHYTSHTKAYNTIYAACNIVEAIYSFTTSDVLMSRDLMCNTAMMILLLCYSTYWFALALLKQTQSFLVRFVMFVIQICQVILTNLSFLIPWSVITTGIFELLWSLFIFCAWILLHDSHFSWRNWKKVKVTFPVHVLKYEQMPHWQFLTSKVNIYIQ